jgi:chromosome segregation ATPase
MNLKKGGTQMRRSILIAAFVLIALGYLSETSVLNAQVTKPVEPQEDKQVLRALLDEMRQLRMALQRSNAVNHRLQITVERLRLQQGRVDSVTRSLENMRSRITDLKTNRPQMEEQIKYAEELMVRATEQNRREEIEYQLKEMKARLASWARDEEQLRERETALVSELQIEQSKLNELNGQLENMIRQLAVP